jgi:hypothetical protein
MGLLADTAGPLGNFTANASIPVLVASGTASFVVLAVVLNILKQLLLKKPNEPPVVFHWFPVLGNTITYGMDPYKFFFENRAKVSSRVLNWQADPMLTRSSTETCLHSFYSAER